MKTRWSWFCLCLVPGLVLLGCGWLVPVHLRAVDASIVLSAGRTGEALLERGKSLADDGRLGAAQLCAAAARAAGMPGWDRLEDRVTQRAAKDPQALFWGNDARTKSIFNGPVANQTGSSNGAIGESGGSFLTFVIQQENREPALSHLNQSSDLAVQELLHCRSLERLVLFPASSSASGQAFDAVVAETGLLLEGNILTPGVGDKIGQLALQANRGGGSQPLEEALMDLASLGERLNWDQLTAFVAKIPDTATLHELAAPLSDTENLGTNGLDARAALFAAVQLSGEPAAVGRYLAVFPKTGLPDLSASLWYGANGVTELADSGRRFYRSSARQWLAARDPFGSVYYFAAEQALSHPWLVLAVKWLCYLGAGFCLAEGLRLSRPPVSELELPLQVWGFHVFREFLFALGFLLAVLLLSEPFLAQKSQAGGFTLRLHLPMAGGGVAAGIAGMKQTLMNPTILLTLLVFFVLQALIYVSCLVKLAEIRRQQVPARMKLKLLENEDHLFDAGLYLGFVGTIVSLIVASLGLVQFSLMAAYSSTSFGIIFVVIFKIFHLRPARRKLLMEAELADANATPIVVQRTAATPVLAS